MSGLFGGLLDAQRREDAVVDGVVQEQDLGRFDEDGGERQQTVGDQEVDAAGQGTESTLTKGPITKKARMASSMPMMPAEKLFTSISKPLLTRPSIALSKRLMAQPPSGPTIMAPMNMGMSVPTMTPMVVMAPTTAPRSPPISLPPV